MRLCESRKAAGRSTGVSALVKRNKQARDYSKRLASAGKTTRLDLARPKRATRRIYARYRRTSLHYFRFTKKTKKHTSFEREIVYAIPPRTTVAAKKSRIPQLFGALRILILCATLLSFALLLAHRSPVPQHKLGAYTFLPLRQSLTVAKDVRFGWGIRDRIGKVLGPLADWFDYTCARTAAELQRGNLASDGGTQEVIYEMAEKDGRKVEIWDIDPFVKVTVPNQQDSYWVMTAQLLVSRLLPESVRWLNAANYYSFIINARTGQRYVVDPPTLECFLKTGNLALIDGMDILSNRPLEQKELDRLYHRHGR